MERPVVSNVNCSIHLSNIHITQTFEPLEEPATPSKPQPTMLYLGSTLNLMTKTKPTTTASLGLKETSAIEIV